MKIPVRDMMRRKGTPYEELGLDDAKWSDDALITLMTEQPILINRPIVANPLAVADSRSLVPEDLIISERRYPHRVGQTYRLRHNPAHQWFYFPHMQRDEALVFKVYDSAKDGRARFTPHTSFNDPATPAGSPPRQSIEVRTMAFF